MKKIILLILTFALLAAFGAACSNQTAPEEPALEEPAADPAESEEQAIEADDEPAEKPDSIVTSWYVTHVTGADGDMALEDFTAESGVDFSDFAMDIYENGTLELTMLGAVSMCKWTENEDGTYSFITDTATMTASLKDGLLNVDLGTGTSLVCAPAVG